MCRFLLVGDSAVSLEFGKEIRPEISRKIRAVRDVIERAGVNGILETVPSYCSLLVHYDPSILPYQALVEKLTQLQQSVVEKDLPQPTVVDIPVCYGGEFGPDLPYVAEYHSMTQAEVISIHSSQDYLVYMLGFIAGFPYLGGMNERIATPRLSVPRERIERGSVGIAGKQTGVYPVASPGGWQLIGRTPLKLYDPTWEKVALLDAGCYVRFRPIDIEEYRDIEQAESEHSYVNTTWRKEM